MKAISIVLLTALALLTHPAQAAKTKAAGAQATSSCPCSGTKLCVGPRGGKYCIAPSGKKRYSR